MTDQVVCHILHDLLFFPLGEFNEPYRKVRNVCASVSSFNFQLAREIVTIMRLQKNLGKMAVLVRHQELAFFCVGGLRVGCCNGTVIQGNLDNF